ncbi:hypothetical protein GGF38_005759, partial [Coemansia sp. RSA 25]
MSYMFLIKDPMLEAMARAAGTFAPNSVSPAARLRPAVQSYLQQTRDALDMIPGYSTIAFLANLSNSPAVTQLSQLITLSYKYPSATYLELALMYYKSIGMPGLEGVINYPSQYIGSIASTMIGGYVSNAISGL